MTASFTCALLADAQRRCTPQYVVGDTYVGNRDSFRVVDTEILQQVLDEDAALSDVAVDVEGSIVGGGQDDLVLAHLGSGRGRHGEIGFA